MAHPFLLSSLPHSSVILSDQGESKDLRIIVFALQYFGTQILRLRLRSAQNDTLFRWCIVGADTVRPPNLSLQGGLKHLLYQPKQATKKLPCQSTQKLLGFQIIFNKQGRIKKFGNTDTKALAYFVDHTTGAYPVAASGVPFDMKYVGVKGDILTDLNEDLAAEGAMLKEQYYLSIAS